MNIVTKYPTSTIDENPPTTPGATEPIAAELFQDAADVGQLKCEIHTHVEGRRV